MEYNPCERLMKHFLPGARIELTETVGKRLWFLPTECEVIESREGLQGNVVRARLSTPVPLRNAEIAEVIMYVERCGSCEVFMVSDSLTINPLLQLGNARIA
jgi:hypothetical protein